jgi:predicted unusual protein kinase regulating ubiquinone biosynthesis (AarF/ABC1/UbiB family)
VLTTEFIEGYKITDFKGIDAAGIDRDRAARILANCYLNQFLIDGFFHADPHPGNLFVRQGSNGVEVAFVDFGMVGEITPTMKRQVRRMVVAVMQRKTDDIIEAMRALNFIRKEEDIDKIRLAITYTLDKIMGLNLGELKNIDYGKFFEELSFMIYDNPLYLPSDFSFLTRAASTLSGVCTDLSPNLNLLVETRPFMRHLLADDSTSTVPKLPGNLNTLINPLILEQLQSTALTLISLPTTLASTLEKVDAGRLQVQFQSQEVKQAAERVDKIGSRIVASVLGASALVSGALVANSFLQSWRGQNKAKAKL